MPCLASPRVWQQRPRLARSNELRAKQRLGVVRGSRCLVLALSGFCGGAGGRWAFLGARTRRLVPNHKHDKRGQESRGAHRGRRQPGRRMGRQRPESHRLPVAGKGREGEERSPGGGGDFPFHVPANRRRSAGRPLVSSFPVPSVEALREPTAPSELPAQTQGDAPSGKSGRGTLNSPGFPPGLAAQLGGGCR